MPNARYWSTCTSSWRISSSLSSWPRRMKTHDPRVTAAAPGGAGAPTRTRLPSPPRAPIALRRFRSVEPGGEPAPVGGGPGVGGAQQLEQVDELLPGGVVLLDPVEELPEFGLDVVRGVGARARQGGDPPGL